MAVSEATTVLIGYFHDRADAERFTDELRGAGIRPDRIGIATPPGVPGSLKEEEEVAVGALAGGAVGAVAGALASGLLPGVGAIAGAGLLALVSGTATAGGLVGALIGMGVSEAEARDGARKLRKGRTMVVVQAGDQFGEALTILRRHRQAS